MKIRQIWLLTCIALLSACSSTPQKVMVEPILSLEALRDISVPIEIAVTDKREDVTLLGYRNAKNEGKITFSDSVSKSLGESIQNALIYQGVNLGSSPKPVTKLEVELHRLDYHTPDETWVSSIEMHAEMLIVVSRSGASLKKRFKANRKQDVVTAPTEEFNQAFMNALLSDLMNKALNDKEVVKFLK